IARFAILQLDLDRFWPGKRGLTQQQIDALCVLQTLLAAIPPAIHNVAFALADFFHIDADWTRLYAVITAASRQIRNSCAGNERLGRCAAFIDARSADVFAFDNRRLASSLGKCRGEWRACLP